MTVTAPSPPHVPGFQILELLGRGGFGAVYLARQESARQLVALKLQHQERAEAHLANRERERDDERFEREARLCAELRHPHIVQLLDKGRTTDGRLFATYQYIPGETLKEYLSSRGALPAPEAGELMTQVLDALVCAHAYGIVHRDLKPQNIMVSRTGARPMVKVLDFGIGAMIPSARDEDYKSLTLSNEVIGTPAYSAPEQLRGHPPTTKTDLYSWALLFLECLTGLSPFEGSSVAEIFHRQLSATEVPLPPAIANHPLGALLRKALKKDAAQRYASAQALWNDLQAVNLTNLVGELGARSDALRGWRVVADDSPTQTHSAEVEARKHQITVLSCALPSAFAGSTGIEQLEAELEQRETTLRSQINDCVDIATRFGGYVVGTLADRLLVYFGHPVASDSDTPRALRAALEILRSFTARGGRGGHIGLHSGLTVMGVEAMSTGVTSSLAVWLESMAPAGEILVSEAVRRRMASAAEFEPFAVRERAEPAANQPATAAAGPVMSCYRYVGQSLLGTNQPATRSLERPMVGRHEELRALDHAWTAAERGEGALFFVSGEPGIGKSRLLRAARQRLDGDSLWCRCLPEQRNNALFPVLELMRAALDIPSVDAERDARARLERALETAGVDLARAMPIFCAWLSLPFDDAYQPSQLAPALQKSEILNALVAWILARADRRPLFLVFEDLHWADPTSLELLERLVAEVHQHALLVVTTSRPELTNPWPGRARPLILTGLDRIDSEAITDMMLDGRRLADDVVRLIAQRTDGVPLFIEELTRMLADTHLVEVGGQLALKPGTDLSTIPSSVRDSLVGRLDRLGTANHTAQLAAAIGREFSRELLMAASPRTRSETERDLQRLQEADLIIRRLDDERERMSFRHALIRDAAYEMLTAAGRRRVHKQIADALEQHLPDAVRADPGVLAGHLFEAGEPARATDFGVRATTIALRRAAFDEAISRSHTLLRWIKELPEEGRAHAELTINAILTPSLMNKYGWAAKELGETATRSLEILHTAPSSPYRVSTLWWVVMNRLVAGNRGTLAELTGQLREMANATGDPAVIAASEALVGYYDYTQGDCEAGRRGMQRALDAYDPELQQGSGEIYGFDIRAWAGTSLARLTWDLGEGERASALAAEGVAWARQIQHVPSLGIALMYQSIVHQYRGEKAQARAVSGELLELARQYGLMVYGAYGQLMHCWASDELAGGEEAFALLEAIKSLHAVAYFYSLLADIDLHQGRREAALARLDKCIALCGAVDEHYYEPHLYLRRAQYVVAAPTGDRASDLRSARADLATARRLASACGAAKIVELAERELERLDGAS